MKITKALNMAISVLFMSVIVLPLLFADFEGGKVSVSENRYLATFPDVFKDGKLVFDPSAFDSWINDNVGGRGYAQKIEGRISYELGHTHRGDIIEGKNQWLYLIPEFDMPEYTNASLPTEASIDVLTSGYEKIATTLNKNGIEFVLAMYPRKYHVYPEFMPSSIKQVNNISAYELIASRLAQSPILNFVNPFDELKEAKEERLTYSKAHDTAHWNNYGAFIGYRALMRQVQEVIPDIRILTEADFTISEQEFETDLGDGFTTTETDLVYELKNNQAVCDKEYLTQLGFNGTDQWRSYNYYRNEDMSLPKAIIVGDSFTWMFQLENLAQSFSELVFIHYNDLRELNLLISQVSPDIVIAPFLSSAVWSCYLWEPDFNEDLQVIQAEYDHDMYAAQVENAWYDNGNIYATVKNSGSVAWSEDEAYRCGLFINGQDCSVRATIEPGETVPPGATYTFVFHDADKLPIESLGVQMLKEGVLYFGEQRQLSQPTQPLAGMPQVEYDGTDYQWLDYCGDEKQVDGIVKVDTDRESTWIAGWAIDPLAGTTASKVVLQVGEACCDAEYGEARESVAAYFGSDDYLNSGYTAALNTRELIDAGKLVVHVVSADGTYQYAPQVYRVEILD